MGTISGGIGRRLFGEPRIDDAGPGVRVARAFDLGNLIEVETAEGPVVVDTTSSRAAAAAARDALAERVAAPPRYLVYTHSHSDHTSGAEALVSDRTEAVVAQAQVGPLTERDHGCLGAWTARHRAHQRGRPLDPPFEDRGYVTPTLTFDGALDLEVGGVTLHLEHTEGETRDHLLVWLPESRVLLPGDLIYPAFPNLSTPAVGPRPIQGWLRSLERFRELGAEHLVPSHGPPISGAEEVDGVLAVYHEAIQHVWDEAVRAIDAGVDVHRAARTIHLPPHLAAHPWLREVYGTVAWGVRAVYDVLTGWYDLTPATLDPHPRAHVHEALLDVVAPDRVVARAEEALAHDDPQLALELTDVVLDVDPAHEGANLVQIEACRLLRDRATSINQRGFYHSGIALARRRLAGEGSTETGHGAA